MEIEYDNYSDNELCQLWKEKWEGSQSSFCRTFSINQGNFNGYCKGTRISKQSRDAIIKFLQEYRDDDQSVTWKTIDDINFIPSPDLKKIIWIDGDNSSYSLEYLKENLPPFSQIFFFYIKGRYSRFARDLGNCQNITFIHSMSQIKDSVDISITIMTTQLNNIVSKNIEYVFISRDHFVSDLSIYFSNFRPCKIILTKEDLLVL